MMTSITSSQPGSAGRYPAEPSANGRADAVLPKLAHSPIEAARDDTSEKNWPAYLDSQATPTTGIAAGALVPGVDVPWPIAAFAPTADDARPAHALLQLAQAYRYAILLC